MRLDMKTPDLKSPVVPLLVTIIGSIVANAAAFTVWYIALGTVLVVAGAFWQYRASQPFSKFYKVADWEDSVGEPGYVIRIPEREHHKGKHVTVTAYERTGEGYQVVFGTVEADDDGNVVCGISNAPNSRHDGKIVIA